MLQRLNQQLPVWARSDHPGIRYVLGSTDHQVTRRRRIIQIVLGVIALALYSIVGLTVWQYPSMTSFSQQLLNVLFWLAFILQLALSVGAMVSMIGIVNGEKQRQVWDNLRVTSGGVEMAMRAQWSATVFYRASGLLALLYLLRVMLVAALLYDLTAFQGEYLDYLTGGIIPEVDSFIGVLLLALTMTASFILPLTGVGLDAAFGLLLATFVKSRVAVALMQILAGGARILVMIILVIAVTYIVPHESTPDIVGWLTLVGFGGFGDWGVRALHLGTLGEWWGKIDYALFLGAGMLVLAFAQAGLTELFMRWAIRRGERQE